MHLQDSAQEVVKKRRRATKKPYSRSIVGATLEVIQKRRSEKPEVRDAAREAALRYCNLFIRKVVTYLLISELFHTMVLLTAVKLRRGSKKPRMRRRPRKQR